MTAVTVNSYQILPKSLKQQKMYKYPDHIDYLSKQKKVSEKVHVPKPQVEIFADALCNYKSITIL